jgi:hypothetical protein
VQRFRREAEAAAQLNSPHVVPIHNYGEIDGRLYVDMRLIEGRDLQTVLTEGPLEPARAVRIIEGVALALHTAHQVGLLHRDVKPSNILLDRNDFAYLIDFGIARAADDTRMTKSGNTIGTFAYIAPERLEGSGKEDARVDIYSLACVLYESLTGEPPFTDDTMPRLIVAHLSSPPPRPSITRPEVPAQVDEVIATGMAKDPDQRYATTVELADAAREAITDRFPQSPSALLTEPAYHAPATQAASPQDHRPSMAALASSTAPTQFDPATGPTSPAPPAGPPTGDQPSRSRRGIALAGGAAAIATTIAVVLVIVFTNGGEHAKPPAASPAKTAPANTGPFTGVYRADFGPSTTYGQPDPGATPSTGQWAVRSACPSAGCVATATATGGPTLQSAFVFDDYGGQWHAVGTATPASPPPGDTGVQACKFPAEYWTAITLQPRPDATLAGQYRAWGFGGDNCETERTVTFTRIGDVDPSSLPDPASQPVRVATAADAFHGRYQFTETPGDRHKPTSVDGSVETACLRTGERCFSTFHFKDVNGLRNMVLNFTGGKWIFTSESNNTCVSGGSNPTNIYWEFPLPQPPQDPITLLTGFGHKDIAGGGTCAGSYNEDVKFERTGD